jgi:Clostripain family
MPEKKEFTLMFYLASDNPLAISVVSQLKAIKAAGFHKQANVVVQFDPFTEGTPTHIFDVNLVNKLKSNGTPNLGFDCQEPSVRNLIEDKLWNGETTRNNKRVRDELKAALEGYDPPFPPKGVTLSSDGTQQESGPLKSLTEFLSFCSREYPASHYMLFILGHGVVVGNDIFLFDENADEHSLSLNSLGTALEVFNQHIGAFGGQLDLLGFHSCSVSSLEVAYELKGAAKYMMASQGTAFVGSWPYRQILQRVFRDLVPKQKLDDKAIKEMLIKIFSYCLNNSMDFLLAGYPFDLCLADLSKMYLLKPKIEALSQALIHGLDDTMGKNMILLAHWESQSFYKEMYTDLADFCFCLSRKLRQLPQPLDPLLQRMHDASEAVVTSLAKESTPAGIDLPPTSRSPQLNAEENVIVCAEFAGPEHQYARGLSVYFPWQEPSMDSAIMAKYADYKLSQELDTSWLDFLKKYFDATKRQPSRIEQNKPLLTKDQALLEDRISLLYTGSGPTDGTNALDGVNRKSDPKDATGGDCNCPSIKNHPRDTRDRRSRTKDARVSLPLGTFFPATSA